MSALPRALRATLAPTLAAGALLAALAGCASAPPATAVAPPADGRIAWSGDGSVVVALASRTAARAWDGASGRERWRLELAGASFPGLPGDATLDELRPLPEGRGAVVVAGGDLWLWSAASGSARRLTATPVAEREARPSPNGDAVAFLRADDLYAIDLRTGEETRLTSGAGLGEAAPPAPALPTFLWAPESRRLAFVRRGGGGGLEIADLGTATTLRLEVGEADLPRLLSYSWRPDGRALGVERSTAEGTRLVVDLCHAEKLYCRRLAERPAPATPRTSFRFLTDGFLWGSTAGDGLGRWDTVGRETGALLGGGWKLRELLAVDARESWAIVTAEHVASPGRFATLAIRIDGPPTERLLVPDRALPASVFSPVDARWVLLERRTAALVALEGGRVAELSGLRPAAPFD